MTDPVMKRPGMGNQVDIEVVMERDCPVINITGDIDLSCSPRVREVILEVVPSAPLTVINMAGVNAIDSSGITSLLEGRQLARKRGAKLVLAGCGESVMRVLSLAKLDEIFDLAVSLDHALSEQE